MYKRQVIDYIKNLRFSEDDINYLASLNTFSKEFLEYLKGFKFTGDIYAIPEGTVVFPTEPLVRVTAPIIEAQIIEAAMLNIINHQSLIAVSYTHLYILSHYLYFKKDDIDRAKKIIECPDYCLLYTSRCV